MVCKDNFPGTLFYEDHLEEIDLAKILILAQLSLVERPEINCYATEGSFLSDLHSLGAGIA
jgi:hypothetical protein